MVESELRVKRMRDAKFNGLIRPPKDSGESVLGQICAAVSELVLLISPCLRLVNGKAR